ncbi:aspartyl/asparaginyl beta-hydroxylase domain-containing protein [Kitasatospora kifunensis]|uniref:Aspartyl/asparaginy/proline hydroxylase domain-containing protein n=1 Tax=Kitasatospora kifunensis TaxID=58351 RepID=A0A7W7VSC7_KITKI|nr:aspartyl/asparaginyl beta-hydroxylase domain-containing protein [Kitasatospora kifunensis]MBB4921046.1 hypothetical protein [Kitasatospora kifunensis]
MTATEPTRPEPARPKAALPEPALSGAAPHGVARSKPALPEAARLRPEFDAGRLVTELAGVTGHSWDLQRISASGGGIGQAATVDWRVLPLRSVGGDPQRTDPGGPGPLEFAPTPWLDRLPYLRAILDSIPAPLNAVRLMALGPGAVSRAHHDPKYRLDQGLVRLHIPIVTQPEAVIVLDGVEHCWQPGSFWYGDFSRTHLVRNTGPATRVHTVIDALLTRELADYFPAEFRSALAEADVLFNQLPTADAAHVGPPSRLPRFIQLPSGFTDFDAEPFDGPPRPARLEATGGQLTLATADRAFALLPAGPDELRFAGWSEQRTLHLAAGEVVLRSRRGRRLAEYRVPDGEPSH